MKTHLLYFFEFEMERPSPRQKSVYQVSLCDKTWNEIINPQTDFIIVEKIWQNLKQEAEYGKAYEENWLYQILN